MQQSIPLPLILWPDATQAAQSRRLVAFSICFCFSAFGNLAANHRDRRSRKIELRIGIRRLLRFDDGAIGIGLSWTEDRRRRVIFFRPMRGEVLGARMPLVLVAPEVSHMHRTSEMSFR